MAGGVVSIVLVAVLLTGVVALNVAVLRLNVTLDRLGRERADLRAGNAVLAAKLSRASATPRIQFMAANQLGYVPADPDDTTYIEVPAP